MAETILDVLNVPPLQLQKAGTDHCRREILPANADGFSCGAASLHHQFHITVKNVAVAGMIPDQSLIVNVFPDFFPDPSHLIHQIPALGVPAANQRSACGGESRSSAASELCRLRRSEGCGACDGEGLGKDMIGFNQLRFFLLSLIGRLIRAVQTASCGHSGLPGLGTTDGPSGTEKRA